MFAQRNYPQELGNGHFTISEAGCLLTAFSNLLERYGENVDPPTLNNFFKEHGLYLRDSDGANEDLAWNSINGYDGNIHATAIGTGIPPSNDAIVKFHYNSVHSGQPIDHFCLVDHIEGDQIFILDSWDGQVKGPSGYIGVYHYPIQWATYVKNVPAPAPVYVPPAVASTPPHAPVAIPGNSERTYTVVKDISGYRTSGKAAAHDGAAAPVKAGQYYIFNEFNNMINVTNIPGLPGSWINPADNVFEPPAPPPVAAPVETPAPTVPTPEAHLAQPPWQTTYTPFRNKFGDVEPKYYIAMHDVIVVDLEGHKPDLTMHQYNVTPISGTLIYDGKQYGRPQSAANKFLWYCIDMTGLELESVVYDSSTDTASRHATKTLKPHDYLVLATAKVEKTVETAEKFFDIIVKRRKK